MQTPLCGRDWATIFRCVACVMVLPAWGAERSLYLRWNDPLHAVNALAADARPSPESAERLKQWILAAQWPAA